MKIKYKEVKTINEFIDAIRIRTKVFTIEQKSAPARVIDENDKAAKHFIAIANNKIVSTVRVRESAKGEMKIGRLATLQEYRNKGISKGLMKYMIKKLLKSNPKRIWGQANADAKEFYEKCGFEATSRQYILCGKPHVDMKYKS